MMRFRFGALLEIGVSAIYIYTKLQLASTSVHLEVPKLEPPN
jgi:hypothetical protein